MKPFEKGIASVFIVGTPLQAISALEAIHEFEVSDYTFFVLKTIRSNQIFPILDKYGIQYKEVDIKKLSLKKEFLKAVFHIKGYQRAFIGHFQNDIMLLLALRRLGFNATIVFIDDGTASLKLLNGILEIGNDNKFSKSILYFLKLKRIAFNSIYSFFDDTKDSNLQYYKNNLICLKNGFEEIKSVSGIFILGTNFHQYSIDYSYPEKKVITNFRALLSYISNTFKGRNIYFVPHGSDDGSISKQLCDSFSINYLKVDKTIELYFIEKGIMPDVLFGFSSTALYILKKICPPMQVYNITPRLKADNNNIHVQNIIIDTFEKLGVKTKYLEDLSE